MIKKEIIVNVVCCVVLILVCSCGGTKDYDEQYLYDKVGFKGNRRPVTSNTESNRDRGKVNKINSLAPENNYYSGYGVAPGSIPANGQINNNIPPARRPVNNFNGGSRFYSNPYAIPPAQMPQGYYPGGYPNYRVYDADRFYVPPNSYRYIEKRNQSPDDIRGDTCNFGC